MKTKLLDMAQSIPDFDSQTKELKAALNKNIHFRNDEEKRLIYIGFEITLDIIKENFHLIRPTLYETMKATKKEYADFSKFKRDYRKLSAISLAVNHLRILNCIAITKIKSEKFVEDQLKQHEADEREAYVLAKNIRQMLRKARKKKTVKHKKKAIWALKIKGEGSDDAVPFIAGYKLKDVALALRINKQYVGQVLKQNGLVKGYKLWREVNVT